MRKLHQGQELHLEASSDLIDVIRGREVTKTDDGALQLLEREPSEAIISDLKTAGMSGLGSTHRQRKPGGSAQDPDRD